jgi:2-polyprenyl-3-methyl-5-hydroxy-6-metoxy-1,4-benzoquinol methylase
MARTFEPHLDQAREPMPGNFAGGPRRLWDEHHAEAEAELENGLYKLRSAPERALLRATIALITPAAGKELVELGCGSSRYLPYLARDAGVRVNGVDFSKRGLQQTREGLASVGADDSGIVEGRIEEYVEAHAGRFDAVVSYGLIEHFSDLEMIVSCHIAAARPGGRILVAAPNLHRLNLAWARRVAPELFEWHRPISASETASVIAAAGGVETSIAFLGGPRLFADPERGRTRLQHLAALATRKLVNGAGEAAYRLAPRLAEGVAGERFSPFFAVAATRAR